LSRGNDLLKPDTSLLSLIVTIIVIILATSIGDIEAGFLVGLLAALISRQGV